MCGRYADFRATQDLADAFVIAPQHIDESARRLPASWNVAPSHSVRIVAESADDRGEVTRRLATARWGLVPAWAKDPAIGHRMINARSETAATKPSFARAMARRRCLIPADAYYEWQQTPQSAPRSPRVPFAIRRRHGESFVFAGLYEVWGPDHLVTTTILTAEATGDLAAIHDRRPLALPPYAWDRWLDPAVDAVGVTDLLSVPAPPCDIYEVSARVNNPRENSADLLAPV